MRLEVALAGIERLFLDTAPVIYLVEQNPRYDDVVRRIFRAIDEGSIIVVTSPITLAECLVVPYRSNSAAMERQYIERITRGRNTVFTSIDEYIARHAAQLRARYQLRLADALQAAVALQAGCDAILTNDTIFSRVAELPALLVDNLQP